MPEEKEDFSLKETSPNIGGGRVSGRERLTSSFDLVEEMWFLYVRIVRGRDLEGTNVTGTGTNSNPYVEINIGNYEATTIYFENKPNPEWNQVFAFTKNSLQAVSVDILVKNKIVVNGEIFGKIRIDMSDIPKRVPPDSPLAPQWYRLENNNGARIRGELMLAMWWGTQADEAFSDAWHSDAAAVSGESIMNCRSKVYVSPKLWYLRVNVIEAQDLVPKQRNRINPEVYVKAALGNVVLMSRVSPNKSVNPTWNEDLMFVAAEPFYDPLILTVEDKLGANEEDCLGRLVMPLTKAEKRFLPIPVSAEWYNLERIDIADGEEKRDVKFASRLCMRLSLDGGYHVFDEATYYASDLRPTMKQLWNPVIGVLELGILSAKWLLPMKSKDGRGTTDAYCVAKYANKWVRTRTVVDSFDPNWNEQYTWEVYDPYTVITLVVFDNCHLQPGVAKDSRIGKVRIRLSTLETDRIYTHSYPLIALQPNGVKKMGEIQLAVRFTCSSFFNLLQTYTQPLLPKMHYIQPLSVYQLDSLRHQATLLLSSRLSRAEPPLRKEVVEYLLDVGSQMWSLRRGKANLARIISVLSGFLAAWRWFNRVRQWKNPTITLLIFVLYAILVYFPEIILPTLLLLLFGAGIVKFRKRPRHPPHMDIALSCADSTHPDELDEEFDTFPSSKQGQILTVRYDRLRSIGGRMIMLLGDLATQLERFWCVLNWRDPRATAMFTCFCLIGAVVISTIPLRLMLLVAGGYVMRHPKFRIDIPALPQNFLRRLPTKADSLL